MISTRCLKCLYKTFNTEANIWGRQMLMHFRDGNISVLMRKKETMFVHYFWCSVLFLKVTVPRWRPPHTPVDFRFIGWSVIFQKVAPFTVCPNCRDVKRSLQYDLCGQSIKSILANSLNSDNLPNSMTFSRSWNYFHHSGKWYMFVRLVGACFKNRLFPFMYIVMMHLQLGLHSRRGNMTYNKVSKGQKTARIGVSTIVSPCCLDACRILGW